MTRDISSATKQDFEFLELKDKVREVIKTRKEWLEFIKYMKVYFEKK